MPGLPGPAGPAKQRQPAAKGGGGKAKRAAKAAAEEEAEEDEEMLDAGGRLGCQLRFAAVSCMSLSA